GADLEGEHPHVVELPLHPHACAYVVGEKSRRAEEVVRGPGGETLPGTPLHRRQIDRGGELVAAVRALLLAAAEVDGGLVALRPEAHVDPGIAEPEAAPARSAAGDGGRAAARWHRGGGTGRGGV